MFFLCWAPFHAQRLLFVWGRKYQYFRDLDEWLYTLSGCLYYFSATVNPILYTLMSVKYRRAFKDMLCCPSKVTGKIIDSNGNRGTSVCQCDSSDGNQLTLIRSSRYPSIRWDFYLHWEIWATIINSDHFVSICWQMHYPSCQRDDLHTEESKRQRRSDQRCNS